MKAAQKLEILSSLATSIAVLLVFFYTSSVELARNSNISVQDFFWSFFFCAVMSLLITLGSYLQAAKKSKWGLMVNILVSALVSIFSGVVIFGGGAFWFYGNMGLLLFALPMILGALAVFFAIRQQMHSKRMS